VTKNSVANPNSYLELLGKANMEITMVDNRLFTQIKLNNLLSFGPDSEPIDLSSLNVFIGPNGTGKSNLIEAFSLIRSTPVLPDSNSQKDVRGVLRKGGTAQEWIWKGAKDRAGSVEVIINKPGSQQPIKHLFSFRADEQGFILDDERVENTKPTNSLKKNVYFYYRFQNGNPALNTTEKGERKLARESVSLELSILAQRRDPELYPEISYLADVYGKCRFYREWSFGRSTVFRDPQPADARNDRLEEDFSNLGLFLSRLKKNPKVKNAILNGLRDLYDGVTDFDVVVEGGRVQVFFIEGDFSIPATRLSDGTLRYLCLLTILCDPNPPPLICIEEPEVGLHPDILPKLADFLVSASKLTQIIITTHSEILVDAMTSHPEDVIVCEKKEHQTCMSRLKRSELDIWLTKYRLGQLWTKGHIGGNRW
jgi:predicted ATPase